MMKNFTYAFILLFSISFMASSFGQPTKKWTMITYLDGSDLESGSDAGTTDIVEMIDAGNTSNVNVLVLTGGANKEGWHTIRAWLIHDGGETELTGFQAANNAMSDPQNLTAFANWAIENYPAEKYVLNMWNHGMAIRGYGHDENTDSQIKVPQVAEAIGNMTHIQNGNYFELIGFDACLMAGLEVQALLTEYGEYFVGSEETEPGHGWNYTPIITAMENGSVSNGAELGTVIVDAFKAQSVEQETSNVTLAIVDLTLVQPVVSALETLFTTIAEDSKVPSLQQARAAAEEYSKAIHDPFNSEDMVDVGDLMKKLKIIDPSLATEADAVLSAVTTAVIHNINDSTRPLATGISMFLPHNKLVNDAAVQEALNDDYNPINFSTTIKDFVVNTYIPTAQSDNNPPGGDQDDTFGDFRGEGSSDRGILSDSIAALKVSHFNDLEQVQVILVEEFVGFPNEYIVLGSTLPDTAVFNTDGTETFAYYWDDHWLGINGHPAYISDIHEYEVEDELGQTSIITRIHIPAILNPDENFEGREIIIEYSYDEDFNVTLESIVPEHYGENTIVPGKERIKLVPGDEIVLLYEVFDEVTDEEFFIVDEEVFFVIENGNTDLHLEHDRLEVGSYHVGFVLMDHSQNDTIIFDSKTFTVEDVDAVTEAFASNNIEMYPNPANQEVAIENNNFEGRAYEVRLYDLNGRLVFAQEYQETKAIKAPL